MSRDSGDSKRSGGGGDDRRSRSRDGRRPTGGGRDGRDGRGGQGGRNAGHADRSERRKPLTVQPGAPLPRWVREEITRSTPKDRRDAALAELTTGLDAFADERFKQAATALRKAKSLSPRAATVREILGLSCYNFESWEEALRELRTFRRITGETMHMAVELDCLRALGRESDIEKTFDLFLELGGDRDSEDEARVVFASHLLDRGRIADAWRVIKPGRLVNRAPTAALRRWAVAARVAAVSGDAQAAAKFLAAIKREDGELEWIPDLERELDL